MFHRSSHGRGARIGRSQIKRHPRPSHRQLIETLLVAPHQCESGTACGEFFAKRPA
jgi:hypothetical protein